MYSKEHPFIQTVKGAVLFKLLFLLWKRNRNQHMHFTAACGGRVC